MVTMGSLKPGATYIYERAEGIIYAREVGADPSTRQVVGYESGQDYDPVRRDKINWHNLLEASKDNKALADALDRVIMLYELSKQHE
jgi:hypothetical protein